MSAERFQISDSNPNDAIGGGGCLCGDTAQTGCTGPFAVFYATETDSGISPHVVLSLKCAEAVVRHAQGEAARIGEAKPRRAKKLPAPQDELTI